MKKKLLLLITAIFGFGYINQTMAQAGAALNFDGNATYVDFGSDPALGLQSANFSVEAWVNPNGGSGGQLILYNGACNVSEPGWGLSYNGGDFTGGSVTANPGKLSFYVWSSVDGQYYQLDQLSNLPLGQWTHVAVTNDGTALKMYINGALDNTLAGNYIPSNSNSSFKIGADPDIFCGGPPRLMYNGSIDELRLYSYPLSQCQIQAGMNCELAGSKAGLVLYCQFNEGIDSGSNSTVTTVADSSGNGFTGTLGNFALSGTTSNWVAPGAVTSGLSCGYILGNVSINATSQTISAGDTATLTGSGALSYAWNTSETTNSIAVSPTVTTTYTLTGSDGSCTGMSAITIRVAGAALNFDGNDDYVSSNNPISHGNQFTYEAWINTTSPNDWAGIMATSSIGGQAQWVQFTLTSGGRLKAEIVDDAGNSKWYEGITTLVNDGNWHHVAITYDGNNNLVFYVDGIIQSLFKQNDQTLGTITINSTLYVGAERNLGPRYFGSIDEARIWSRALCQTEILNNMSGEIAMAPGLLANYHFNEGFDNSDNTAIVTLTDSSGNSIDGTLNNFALTGSSSNWVASGAVTTGSIAPAFISIVPAQTNVTCNGNTDGTASVTVTGAASPFTYAWSSGGSTTNSATGLAAGKDTCTINYACGTTIQTFTITEPAILKVAATAGTISCNGSTTTATVSATGGTPGYTGTGTFTITANSYTYTVSDTNSCSADTTITVTQPNAIATTQSPTICAGSYITVGTNTYTIAGTYTDVLTAQNGCDSTVTTNLSVNNAIDTSLTVSSNTTITANATGASYQWIDCNNNNTPISGETNQSFNASSGSYAVIITVGSCSDTSGCTVIQQALSIVKNNQADNLMLYPNPVINELTINSNTKATAMVFDILGNKITEFVLQNQTQTISLGDLAPGVYYLQVNFNMIKFIKR
jgi:hypothetical protein